MGYLLSSVKCLGVFQGGGTTGLAYLCSAGQGLCPCTPLAFCKKLNQKLLIAFVFKHHISLKIFDQTFYKKFVGGVGGEPPRHYDIAPQGKGFASAPHQLFAKS